MSSQQPPSEGLVNNHHQKTNTDFVTTVNAKLDIIKERKKAFELLQQVQVKVACMDIQKMQEAEAVAQENMKKAHKELAAKKELIANCIEARAVKTTVLEAELKTEQEKLTALVDKHLPDLTGYIGAVQLAPAAECLAYIATAMKELSLSEVSGKAMLGSQSR